MNKKRVLVMGEAHYLHSGFGTYTKELLTRLHKTGKYELAEFASYGHLGSAKNVPWLFIPNMPDDSNPEETKLYNSNGSHQFGTWRFEHTCLDFKPDIVLSYRDPWMDNWIGDSALRNYFHWVWMPTVDSSPQRAEWMRVFAECDAILTYSEFGGEVLKQQGKETINWIGCASPGIDSSIYKPMPKVEHRKSMGVDPDCFIVGTVMRNQKRKLFFELMKAFRLFLDQAPPEIAGKTYLYLHTSYPEKIGWDIAHGILENNLGNKVLMTYICKNCKQFFTSVFHDALCYCKFCKQHSAVCPTVSVGLSIPDLAKVYNLFDIYVQYAICEGFGMPQVEAAACGVPVAATDYSAMSDVVRWTKGYPIAVETFFRELETNAERAYPKNAALANILTEFFNQSDQQRLQKSIEVREATTQRYSWDETAKVWESYIDSYIPKGTQGQWDVPPNLVMVPDKIPSDLSNSQFAHWIFNNVLHKPHKIHEEEGLSLIRSLNYGADMRQGVLEPTNRDKIFEQYKSRTTNYNNIEHARVNFSSISPQPFLIAAHQRQERTVKS